MGGTDIGLDVGRLSTERVVKVQALEVSTRYR